MVRIFCRNTGTSKQFAEGTTLVDILKEFSFENEYPIVSAKVNNVSQGLKFRVFRNRDVEFLDVRATSGMHVYCRSLCFLFCKAAKDEFPGCRLQMEHPLSDGFFCRVILQDGSVLDKDGIMLIKNRMWEIVNKDMPFHYYEVQTEEAIRIFRERGYDDKVKLIETSGQVYMDYYVLGDTADYYYGRLVPSAGYLTVWNLVPYRDGMLLLAPDKKNPDKVSGYHDQPKSFEVFAENKQWNEIMGLETVGDVNHACRRGEANELIQIAEALQEKKIVQIAEEINRRYRKGDLKVVLITGPSSSGKTTFCRRLTLQLKVCGLKPISFSTDDYFVNRVDTPLLPDGKYDFDNFDTVDHAYLQRDLKKILAGEEVELPEYNFRTGEREYNGKRVRLGDRNILLIEGIHALNPKLTEDISPRSKFKVFISTMTSISLDSHNWIPTADNRLLRRIVRDYNKGAFSAVQSISQWPSVLDAEQKWIYPFQETADVMFNSAYLIEFAVLRNSAEIILQTVPKNCPEYSEAHRLLKFLRYFNPVSDKEIPPTSLMREFLGGSAFK